MDLDIYSTYKIFLRNLNLAKIIAVFQQSIISYINKLEYLARPFLILIVCLRLLFLLYINFSLTICLQEMSCILYIL